MTKKLQVFAKIMSETMGRLSIIFRRLTRMLKNLEKRRGRQRMFSNSQRNIKLNNRQSMAGSVGGGNTGLAWARLIIELFFAITGSTGSIMRSRRPGPSLTTCRTPLGPATVFGDHRKGRLSSQK
ncbi:MAG: hypothetical protein WBB19_17620 [Desulforhopalus sp.]